MIADRSPQIAPSILSADFARLGEEIAAIEAGGADIIHVDVMDGHFVPNLTLGPPIVAALKRVATKPLDTHLMIEAPERYIEAYAAAGSAWISVHAETCPHLHGTIQQIRRAGAEPGVVLNPHTPLSVLDHILGDLHHVLIMSVNPGFGGQSFIPGTLAKLRALRAKIDTAGLDVLIEIDGGVKAHNITEITEAGADILVAGSAVFGADDYGAAISELRKNALQGAAQRS